MPGGRNPKGNSSSNPSVSILYTPSNLRFKQTAPKLEDGGRRSHFVHSIWSSYGLRHLHFFGFLQSHTSCMSGSWFQAANFDKANPAVVESTTWTSGIGKIHSEEVYRVWKVFRQLLTNNHQEISVNDCTMNTCINMEISKKKRRSCQLFKRVASCSSYVFPSPYSQTRQYINDLLSIVRTSGFKRTKPNRDCVTNSP